MKCQSIHYERHRFPPAIIQHAAWLYYRFSLSHRDVEDILARRGVLVTHESIRLWCNKFGPRYAHRLRRAHRGYGDTVFMDEVFVRIGGRQRYLWRAVIRRGGTSPDNGALPAQNVPFEKRWRKESARWTCRGG